MTYQIAVILFKSSNSAQQFNLSVQKDNDFLNDVKFAAKFY